MTTAQLERVTTEIFPRRVPEGSEAMTPDESASLAAWQMSPQGRGLYAALAEHVKARLGLERGRIVSVGEGEGHFANELSQRLPGAEIVGTDLCPEVVRRARQKHLQPNLRFSVLPVLEIESAGPADAVVSVFALHHFEDAKAGLAAAFRALAPRGRIFLHDLRRDASMASFESGLELYRREAPAVGPLFRASVQAAYTVAELRSILAEVAPGRRIDVRPFRFVDAALDAFRGAHPAAAELLPGTLDLVYGLWLEALVT